ncbi:collagen alpha-4(VI) chain-like [Alosa pseudoharengus]|uniref:collagen alpha-4(VI) chain-like n=1 Tax=Alosa pseudoharengus TaxID=34774 RepID=UPI003F8B7315
MAKTNVLFGAVIVASCFLLSASTECIEEKTVADIVFLVDGSESIGTENFQRIREFLHTLVNGFDVSPDHVRIGMVQYSNIMHTEFSLNTYQNKAQILEHIDKLGYMMGKTLTGKGLNFILKEHFVQSAGSRASEKVPQIAVVITDGMADDDVGPHAMDLKNQGIIVYAIGVKDAVELELRQIASEPQDQHVYSVSDFTALQGITQKIVQKLCFEVEEVISHTTPVVISQTITQVSTDCQHATVADIVFLVDCSGSIGHDSFNQMKQFLKSFVSGLPVAKHQVRIGLAQFDHQTYQEFLLKDHDNVKDALDKIDQLQYHKGATYLGSALTFLQKNYFTPEGGSRDSVPKIAIVITDGASMDAVAEPALKLRSHGVVIFAVGVGYYDAAQLRTVASSPSEQFLISIHDYQELQKVMDNMRKTVCTSVEIQAQVLAPKYAEVFFLVDSSAQSHIQAIREMLIRLANQLNVNKEGNRMGLAQYGSTVSVEFQLDQYTSESEVVDHIKRFTLTGSQMRKTGGAISYASHNFFSLEDGTRGYKQYLVLIISGKSDDNVMEASNVIKDQGVTVLTVGLDQADRVELEIIATQSYVFIGQCTQQIIQGIATADNTIDIKDTVKEKIQGISQMIVHVLCTTVVTAEPKNPTIVVTGNEPKNPTIVTVEEPKNPTIVVTTKEPKNPTNVIVAKTPPAPPQTSHCSEGSAGHLSEGGHNNNGQYSQHTKQDIKILFDSEKIPKVSHDCIQTDKADIYFLIDHSTSIRYKDFRHIKKFVLELIWMFRIGPHKVRVGLVKFSNSPKLEFRLSQYTDRESLEDAVIAVHKTGGNTYIGHALNFMSPLFKETMEDRGHAVPKYLIVITDANSHDRVEVPAKRLRQQGITIYAIGLKGANERELDYISGDPKRKYLINNFNAFIPMKDDIVKDICSQAACKNMLADVIFLVDGSGSIDSDEFYKIKRFINVLIQRSIQVHPDAVRVGLLQYSGTLRVEYTLCAPQTLRGFLQTVNFMRQLSGTTLTGGALSLTSQFFDTSKGGRPGVPKILIVLTDGEARDDVVRPVRALRRKNIIIYSVGVERANVTQLREISGRPGRLFMETNFDALQNLESDILPKICQPDKPDTTYKPDKPDTTYKPDTTHMPDTTDNTVINCSTTQVADMIFLVDGSSSIFPDQYKSMERFMMSVVDSMNVGEDHVRFGAIVYSTAAESKFTLNQFKTAEEVRNAIANLNQPGGITSTGAALRYALDYFGQSYGGRREKKVPQILFVITDGAATDPELLPVSSLEVLSEGIMIYGIGVAGAMMTELQVMTGGKNKRVFYVDNFDALKTLQKKISKELCEDDKQNVSLRP